MERCSGSDARGGIDRRIMLLALLGSLGAPGGAAARVADAWRGPMQGPRASGPRNIAVLAEDMRNGGVLGVTQGLGEAARELQWKLHVYDATGTPRGRRNALQGALDTSPDAVAVCGVDARTFEDECRRLAARPAHAVGWHVTDRPGPMPGSMIAINVSTDPDEVGQVAARAVARDGGERSGVVIFTDSRFAIATAKAQAMARTLEQVPGATLLETLDVSISDSAVLVPPIIRRLLHEHGARWTHALAINDVYFDHAVPVLIAHGDGARHVRLISAGDGSASAFVRIRSGIYQTATVAEPLHMQGWQMADELNRLQMGQPVSGFVTPAALVTRAELLSPRGAGLVFDPPNGYRDVYRRIWTGAS